jgi:outer membrane protein OmpA-like peptidoglycan-associated protein
MKSLKFLLILWLVVTLALPICGKSNAEELVIPPEAHQKAIQALKALGPGRGAKKINYHMCKIERIVREIVVERKEIQSALKDLGAKVTDTEIQIELSGDVLFDFDKWNIRPDAEESLKKVAEVIKAYKSAKVVISGHTDSIGPEEYNQTLSERRAESVKNWLSENGGINPEIVETVGYGESKPVALNTNTDGSDNPAGRQENRRVEILVKI